MIVTCRASGDGAFQIGEIFKQTVKRNETFRKTTVTFHLRKEEK